MTESEWKRFSKLAEVALERFCERVLAETVRAATAEGKSNHERYLTVFRLIENRDRELGDAFNERKRSNALLKLMQMRALRLIEDDEVAQFEPDTRAKLAQFADR